MTANLIYIGYASGANKDDVLARELEDQLAPLERPPYALVRWSERNIPPGANTDAEISDHLSRARVIVLLVTSSFLADPHCQDLVGRALALRQAGQADVIPVIGDFCLWDLSPLGQLNPLPDRDHPVSSFANRNEAWNKIVRGILQVASARDRAASPVAPLPPPRQPASTATPPTRATVRKLLEIKLISDSDFDAFCLDYYPDVHRRFSAGMDRVAKSNLLLQYAALEDIVRDLG